MNKLLLLSTAALCANTALATVFPENDLDRNDDINRRTEVTREVFESTMKRVQSVYAPIVSRLGGQLLIQGDWNDSTVNGQADREGNRWLVTMGGGLARVPEMKPDFFLFQVCHELGHHVAGFPFTDFDGIEWYSAESEADYYATRVCLKKMFAEEQEENARIAASAPELVTKRCSETWSTAKDRNLCARITTLGEEYARLYAKMRGWYKPSVDTPEDFEVYQTFYSHAKSQVKLDVYFAGAVCNAPWDDAKIPGYRADINQRNSLAAEQEAAKYSCHPGSGYVDGLRPKSYFSPGFDFKAMQTKGFVIGSIPSPGKSFRIDASLTNASTSTTTGISSKIESRTAGVSVTSGTANVKDIAPNKTEAMDKPFLLKIDPSFQCGAPFELKITSTSASAGTASAKKTFFAGRFVETLAGRNATVVEIPEYGDATSSIQVAATGAVRRVHVKANIVHQYARDMKIFIISPDGTMRFLTSPEPADDDIVKLDKEVDLPMANGAGEWQLFIVDDMPYSSGRLVSWELNLKKALCD